MRHWYHSTIGIIVAGIIVSTVTLAGVLMVLTFRYLSQIKTGQTAFTGYEFIDRFTAALGASTVNTPVNRTELEVSNFPPSGSPDAPITIVEFVDFKCPNCRLAAPIVQQVLAKYGARVKLLIRHFPIESLHPGATHVSIFAECAGQQGAFWPAYSLLFARQDTIGNASGAALNELIGELGLSRDRLLACMADQKAATAVSKDYAAAVTYGVRGTPTFFINGQKWEGVVPLDAWDTYLKSYR